MAAPDVKQDLSLLQALGVEALTSFVEEIDLHLAADNVQKLLSWLDLRAVSEKMRVSGDSMSNGEKQQANLKTPLGFGHKSSARSKIVCRENQGIGLVSAKRLPHELPLLSIEISSSYSRCDRKVGSSPLQF